MKKSLGRYSSVLLLGLSLASCAFVAPGASTASGTLSSSESGTSSSNGTSSSGTSSNGTSISSGTSTSTGGTSTSMGPSLPDQSGRLVAIKAFTEGKISIDINRLLGVRETSINGRKRQAPTHLVDRRALYSPYFKASDDLAKGNRPAQASASSSDPQTLVSTKDYVFTPNDADPYYYTGIKPDGTLTNANYTSPILNVKNYGDTIAALVYTFIASNPYVDVTTKIGGNEFLLHYEASSGKSTLLINDKNYFCITGTTIDGAAVSASSYGRTIAITMAFDEAGHELLDAQAYSPVTYSANYATIYPNAPRPDYVYGGIHFVEGLSYDYYNQSDPRLSTVYSVRYGQGGVQALFAEKVVQPATPDQHMVSASLLEGFGIGSIEREIHSLYNGNGALIEQDGEARFYDAELKEQFHTNRTSIGTSFAQTITNLSATIFQLGGWTTFTIPNGTLKTSTDAQGVVHSYHYAEKAVIKDLSGASHDWLLDSNFDAYGLLHGDGTGNRGYIAAMAPQNIVDFSVLEFGDINLYGNESKSVAITTDNSVEGLGNALAHYGYQFLPGIAEADRPSYIKLAQSYLNSFNDDIVKQTWEGHSDALRVGIEDLIEQTKSSILTLSTEQIVATISAGFKANSELGASDASGYLLLLSNPIFEEGATVRDLLARMSIMKSVLSLPDLVLDVKNVGTLKGLAVTPAALSDALVDQQAYFFHVEVNGVALIAENFQVRVAKSPTLSLTIARNDFYSYETYGDVLAALDLRDATGNRLPVDASHLYAYTRTSEGGGVVTALTPVSGNDDPILGSGRYAYLATNDAGETIGYLYFKIRVIELPYQIEATAATAALSESSTLADFLASLQIVKSEATLPDITLSYLNVVEMDAEANLVTPNNGKELLKKGTTYGVYVGENGVLSARFIFYFA
jgi:hypothetical protein